MYDENHLFMEIGPVSLLPRMPQRINESHRQAEGHRSNLRAGYNGCALK